MDKVLAPIMVLVASIAGQFMLVSDAHSAVPNSKLERGRATYERFCASCHGATGAGEKNWLKRNEFGELPAPPHDATGHTWKHSDGMLYRVVREGWRDPFNRTQRLTMPPFKEVLKPHEIRDVIDYLKTMWTPEQRKIQQADSKTAPFPSEASSAVAQRRGRAADATTTQQGERR